MVKSIHVLFFFLIALVVISGCEYNNDIVVERASLIVADIDDSDLNGERTQHLIKYEFAKGELVSTETIVTNPGGQLRFNCEKSQVYQNRYIITDCGDIVDITTRQFIHRGVSGSAYSRLLGLEGDYVFFFQPQTEDYYYYDLTKQEYNILEDPGKWALPGLLSPDGTMSVSSSNRNEGQVWLHYINGEMKLLGEGFYVEYSPLSSSMTGVPLIWLDSERVLTQKSNGEIVIVTVDGSIVPVVNIDLSHLDFDQSGWKGALKAKFFKDFNSNIIYSISLIGPEGKFRDNRFVIDVENESYSTYDPEWIPLGHKFEYSSREGITVIRYDGYDIGQEQCFTEGYEQTIKGHIAITRQESCDYYPTSIRVWSSANGKWTSMDFEFPVWITYSSIIGWIE
jgi:hypothetical protein